ncbi:transposase [Sulfitobacter sp. NFXS29]|uniref:IS4/Tn5 family transposase DNA-binding protein n=1 Tax=Sulfitobacter sp. NFXS29 TaxID=2818438 RepID=UPI0032DECA66
MGQNWVGTETARCDLGDVRLNGRLEAMLAALGDRPGKSLATAFRDWSNTKAAYRFFSNENVSEDKFLEGHFAATGLRFEATNGTILILQDTTEFTFKRFAPEKVGFKKISTGRKMKEGRGPPLLNARSTRPVCLLKRKHALARQFAPVHRINWGT